MRSRLTPATIRAITAEEIARAEVPGASVAVIADGGPVTGLGVGVRDPDGHLAIRAYDRFLLYSVTKVIIAIAVIRMTEVGRVDLDQPVREVLPEIALDPGVTFRRLLNHTAGIGDYGGMPEYAADLKRHPEIPWTEEEYIERVLSRGSVFRPGEGWAYSNVGYLLLRLAVQRIAGASLREVLDTMVFEPIGLRHTVVVEQLEDTRVLTPAWSNQLDDHGELHDVSRRYHPGWVSHGVVMSTAAETTWIIDALFGGGLVRPDSLEAMLGAVEVPASHPLIGRPGYGLGLMIDRDTSRWRVAGHGGGGPGYSTAAFHFQTPDGSRLTSVALANRDAGDVGTRIAFAIADRWAGSA